MDMAPSSSATATTNSFNSSDPTLEAHHRHHRAAIPILYSSHTVNNNNSSYTNNNDIQTTGSDRMAAISERYFPAGSNLSSSSFISAAEESLRLDSSSSLREIHGHFFAGPPRIVPGSYPDKDKSESAGTSFSRRHEYSLPENAHHFFQKQGSLSVSPLSNLHFTSFSNSKPNFSDVEYGKKTVPVECQGVTLTWKDVWVTVNDCYSDGGVKPLLQSSSGFVESGQMLAIMGPSGSGKTTLLDTLAGRLSSHLQQSGEVLVNGRKQTLSYGNAAYVTQDDVLMASLTVWEAVFYSAQLQLPKSLSLSEKRERAESIIKDMGLLGAAHTRIGGWRARGLSGGERRRVSIAIELLTRPGLIFLDEPTSGLDSAAAFHIMKRLRRLATEGRTIIISIHQPSGDVFELFHFLYLLANGSTVFFGPTLQAQEFFSTNGFPCPPNQSPSDHYLRTINMDYEEDTEEGDLKTGHAIQLLVEAYNSSEIAWDMAKHLNDLQKREGTVIYETSGRAGFLMQVYVLTKRSFKNMYRDIGYYWLRLAMYIGLAICVGTVYYNVGYSYSAIQARAALLMFISGLLTLMAIGGFPAFIEDLRVFDKERLNGHYGVASYFIANTISSSPYLLLISSIPGCIAYFLAGLHPGWDRFVYFILDLYVSVLVVESLMMMVASFVQDYLLGIIVGAGIQGFYLLTGGFFRLPNDIPKPVWKYPVSYLAYQTYAIQGFYKNDFVGLQFQNIVPGEAPIAGELIVKSTFQVMECSKWLDLLALVTMAMAYRLLFFLCIKFRENIQPMIKGMLSAKMSTQPRVYNVLNNAQKSISMSPYLQPKQTSKLESKPMLTLRG